MADYFFLSVEENLENADLVKKIERYSSQNRLLTYIVNRPLTDQKYDYSYENYLIVLSPKHKITIVNFKEENDDFLDFTEDLIEDLASISDKYDYKSIIGRPRKWKDNLINTVNIDEINELDQFYESISLNNEEDIKRIDLLISLFIGSINDMKRVKKEVPKSLLDKVKQKIQLFDSDQTRFIYQKIEDKRITIQGLSGTGKTELLLHKLKDLYVGEPDSLIYFTCHNKILADNLNKRVPAFFNFMKVEQQIEWNKRLWCTGAWGSENWPNSGLYSLICHKYGIPFYNFKKKNFSDACKTALEDLKKKYGDNIKPILTYTFIDESQDFDENFFQLCEIISKKSIFIAGDIFQNIFDEKISTSIKPNFLLAKCYRTDPKTLMFAHALGMGLFEKSKLRWLEKKEWEDCGYNVVIEEGKYFLSREPLRRFEDLDEDFESISIIEFTGLLINNIINIIKKIKTENETLLPDDIGVIFLDNHRSNYAIADRLEFDIQRVFGWDVNKAYETKEKRSGALFISNRNNVKGLEFPFVICLTRKIGFGSSYRNSLYTMLTRSFIKSFLVIPDSENLETGLTQEMTDGLNEIVNTKQMIIAEPNEEEKVKIRTRFEYRIRKHSHFDIMNAIFKELEVDAKYHSKLMNLTKQAELIEQDEETLTEFVQDNLKYLN